MMWQRQSKASPLFESVSAWGTLVRRVSRILPLLAFVPLAAASEDSAPVISSPSDDVAPVTTPPNEEAAPVAAATSEEPVPVIEPPEEDAPPTIEPPSFVGRMDERGLLEPCTGPGDWIHLTSSEWLYGDLRELKHKRLEFKSVRLNIQSIKWKHIVELCTPYPMRFISNKMEVLTGPARMRGGKLTIWQADGSVIEIQRDRIFAILRGEPTEWNRWTLKASLGLDANTGNTEQTSFNAGLDISRRAATTLVAGNYQMSLGSSDGKDNVNRHQAEIRGQKDITRRLYVSALDVGILADQFQNIALRATPGSGLGYRFLDSTDLEFEIEADVIYQRTNFVSAPPDSASSTNDAGNRISARLRWDATGDLEFTANHSTTLVYTDFRLSSYNTRVALIYDLTDILKLEIRLNHNRVQEPIPNANNDTPKRDDLQLIVSFGFEWRP
jgi:putative salt-induced outer membrane protein YdiY